MKNPKAAKPQFNIGFKHQDQDSLETKMSRLKYSKTVLLIDDHPLFRTGLRLTIEGDGSYRAVA